MDDAAGVVVTKITSRKSRMKIVESLDKYKYFYKKVVKKLAIKLAYKYLYKKVAKKIAIKLAL